MAVHIQTVFGVKLPGDSDPIAVAINGTVGLKPLRLPNIGIRQTTRPINGRVYDLPTILRALTGSPVPEPKALEAPRDPKRTTRRRHA